MTEQVIIICVGLILVAIGFLLTLSERAAALGLSIGRARIWVKLLGYERAMKLTRYFFGPFTILLGLAGVAIAIVGK